MVQLSSLVTIILPLASLIQCSNSFVVSTTTRLRRITAGPPVLQRLSSSRTPIGGGIGDNGDSGGEPADELSKLISKRNQIKRKKKEEDKVIEERLMESWEPTIDLDLEKLPEFRTVRPSSSSSSSTTAASSSSAGSKSSKSAGSSSATEKSAKEPEASFVPVVDYLSDYDDENDFHIPNRIGITGSAWGDPTQGFVKSGGKLSKRMLKAGMFNAGDIQVAIHKLLAGGITLIETGPNYGAASRADSLTSEHILAQSLTDFDASLPESKIIATSGVPAWKSLLRPGSTMVKSLEKSLAALGDESAVELFVAPANGIISTRIIAAGLAAQIESGQANRVGVTGLKSARALKRLIAHLEQRDCQLAAAIFDGSLTKPKLVEPMIAACKKAGVVPIISDPWDGGLASGVFTAANPSGGLALSNAKFSFQQLEKLQPLHSVLETVSERVRSRVIKTMRATQDRFKGKYGPPPSINTDITTSQIALHWIIAKGGVPLAPVNNPGQADVVLGCLGWTLQDDEVSMLDNAAAFAKR
jgi:aryl-alcohol dehydrogenase-like predicted oxidoreductase